MFSYYGAQPKYRRASKVVAETYTLKTAAAGRDKPIIYIGESSMAPRGLNVTTNVIVFVGIDTLRGAVLCFPYKLWVISYSWLPVSGDR